MLFSFMRLFLQPSPLRTESRTKGLTRRSQRGFTLLETLVVMSISGLLLGLSYVTLGKLAPQFALNDATRTSLMAINQARVRAITRGHNVTLAFGSNSFTISDPGDVVAATRNLPPNITASSVPLTFTPLGRLQAGSVSVSMSNGSSTRLMYVLPSGEILS